MGAPRNRRHLLVSRAPTTEAYTSHPPAIPPPFIPAPPDRARHARQLRTALLAAAKAAGQARKELGIAVHGAQPGLYVEFDSQPGVPLDLGSLENRRPGVDIELVAVTTTAGTEGAPVQRATVFVPDGQVKQFITRFEKYATETTAKGKPKHAALDRVAALRRATLRALWTDSPEAFPEEDAVRWWEIWLRRDDGSELERFSEFAALMSITMDERRLAFDDRVVVLAKASAKQLAASLDVLDDLAELRGPKETARFFHELSANEQRDWIDEARSRRTLPPAGCPAVCILDTGITRAHPLLEDLVAPGDAMAVDPTWGAHDNGGFDQDHGHGTSMAGLAAYGDLVGVLESSSPIVISHCLESVKILPPNGANKPELYGAITAEAVSRPEANNPARLRTFSMAITAKDERDRGQPTSWSAAIDALAAGRSFDPATKGLVYMGDADANAQRLFILSAGNIGADQLEIAHLNRSDVEPVHDPAQAWNALTVGGYTEKVALGDPEWESWSPVAPAAELSPWSTTSGLFQSGWPAKPDVVLEAGNVAHDGTNVDFPVPDLSLLSTYYRPAVRPLVLSWGTSPATALVARLATMLRADYPEFWPETIRALVVHSARWTQRMQSHLRNDGSKAARARLARRYGAGVPDLERMRRSAADALTLVVQSSIRPFDDGALEEMHLHALPWPTEVLASLGQASARLRVTLSYFVEPNPSRRGWRDRHRYASHGLRFDVRGATETTDDFRKRLNKRALEDGETKPGGPSKYENWFFGEARNKGSIHTDVWTGTAVDLAARGVVGVFPVSGWWMELPKRDRSALGAKYALIVSIETDAEEVDLWTPVAQEIGIPVEGISDES